MVKKSDVSDSDADKNQQEDSPELVTELAELDNFDGYDKDLFANEDDRDVLSQVAGVYQIWGNWAYFELAIVTPEIAQNTSVSIISPEQISGSNDSEFVYPIFDYGDRLSTSKGTEMYSVGTSMCKLYYTIEKMISILIERLKDSGIDIMSIESKVAFDGHQLAQRKAFESIINLNYNVVVTNFDPGEWGDRYLATIKKLADKGYGFPSEAPRDVYKKHVEERPVAPR